MREQLKNIEYFKSYFQSERNRIDKFENWIDTGRTPEARIPHVKNSITEILVGLTVALYSSGASKAELLESTVRAIEWLGSNWSGFWKLKNAKGDELDQYILSAYDEMLWMLSLGYLLNVPDETFTKLVEVIDRDNVKDHLFEFIICAKLPERKPIQEESYREHFGVPKVFEKLRRAITVQDKGEAQELIKVFLEKDWYNNHKDAGWYNSHKSKHNTYFGYWSFETAAVVKIMNLNDNSFKENEYYPKDLVR